MRRFLFQLIFLQALSAAQGAEIDFNRDIRPILSNNCIFCHGPDETERKAGLRLDTQAGMLADGVVVPGDPGKSTLIERITTTDSDEVMPPPESSKALDAEQKALLHRWIEEGAEWKEHWAYVDPARVQAPESGDGWALNAVDRFISQRLEKEGLKPSPETDRATLLRRLSLDLTGLPPTLEESERFLEDDSDNAYEALVDRLLASEHFGERMAMYWLDLVRYADTVGYHGDQDHQISPYRDYVIDAFNEDMPFDQFTREQLAGDLLPESGVDQKIASGYNRLLQTSHEGGVQVKEYLAIYAADRVRNVSAVWMGATVGCAQCHDHKYDPYTAKDFYALSAFFADIDEEQHFRVGTNALPTKRPPEIDVLSKRQRRDLMALEGELATAKREGLSDETARLQAACDAINAAKRRTMITVARKTPRETRLLPRGNWLDDSGDIVLPAFPSFLAKETEEERLTRLDLAHWLTDGSARSGRLTARVFANRFWYLLFGSGLSKVMADFGGQGEAPVHPELLDHLAHTFIDHGWRVKPLLKELVMSRTYRQDSQETPALMERDPDNRLYARQSRHRLDAEMIRDGALLIGGLLEQEIGGGSVKPYQPAGYFRHLNFPVREYKHHQDARQWRRGVYVHWQRQFLHPMMRAFDAPSREECTAERARSNTPTAALTLLNDPTFVEAARSFAQRLLLEKPEAKAAERVEYAFRLALARSPQQAEVDILVALHDEQLSAYQSTPDKAALLLKTGQATQDKTLDPAEWAAWTAVTRAILNLDETITRH